MIYNFIIVLIYISYILINIISLCFRPIRYLSEMWLRSEHVSRRLRGRLNISCTSETKIYNYRVQVRNIRKLPSINNNSHHINIPNKYGRLTRWRRRCTHFLKEVCITFYFFFLSSSKLKFLHMMQFFMFLFKIWIQLYFKHYYH